MARLDLVPEPCARCGRAKVCHLVHPDTPRAAYVECRCGSSSRYVLFRDGDRPHIEAEELAIMDWNSR